MIIHIIQDNYAKWWNKMPMHHTIQKQLIKEKLKDLQGKPKIKKIDEFLEELPTFTSGPYVELRKWLEGQKNVTKTRSKTVHKEYGIKKEGLKQFMLVGKPSAGKSSLLKALSKRDVKIAEYAFTTLEPIPAIVDINGAEIQLVDLPGLIEGATEDKGGGKRFVGLIRQADGIIVMHDLTKAVEDTEKIIEELRRVGIEKKTIIVGNKIDLDDIMRLRQKYPEAVGISAKEGIGLEELKQKIWEASGLIKVYTKRKPVILEIESTIKNLTEKIHKELLKKFKHARVTGNSAKFPNQKVGLSHVLEDEDKVELKLKI